MRNKLANSVVRAVARTPAYRLLSRHLVLRRYTGRRTGRRYELPVLSAQAGKDLVVVPGKHEGHVPLDAVAPVLVLSGGAPVAPARPEE